jgi:hypothetical protein
MHKNHKLKAKTLNILSLLWLALVFNNLSLSSFAGEEFVYNSQGRRDPFTPLITPDGRIIQLEGKADNKEVMLEGIIYDKHGLSYAVINGEVVKIGDTVSGHQVLKIYKDRVVFIKEGQIKEVELKEEEEIQ